MPLWFREKTTTLTNFEKNIFLKNFNKEPSLHIVFKNSQKLKKFEDNIFKTSDVSGFLTTKRNIEEMKSFQRGDWWVQDFSSFFPLHNLQIKEKNKKFLDACAAPGGKSFQILSKKYQLTLNDKSKKRIQILKMNLNRLNFNNQILNIDFIKFKEQEKYDYIIIDAPCSAVGTIRKNPEIFFKSKGPDFAKLFKLQEAMLDKASNLLNINGLIIYMVCSFLKIETESQISNFLSNNNDYELVSPNLFPQNMDYNKLKKEFYIRTLPDTFSKYYIDGYFAAYLKKIK